MIKKILAVALLLVLIGFLIVNVTDNSKKNTEKNEIDVTGNSNVEGAAIFSPSDSPLKVGQKAPNFELETLSGNPIKLSDLRGKKVFINFWATWCPPCKKEMPEMQKFYEQHSNEIEILAVNVTGQERGVKAVQEFIDKYNYTYPIVLDKELSVSSEYNAIAYPTTYFIGTDGVIQQPRKVGPMTNEFMQKMLKKLD